MLPRISMAAGFDSHSSAVSRYAQVKVTSANATAITKLHMYLFIARRSAKARFGAECSSAPKPPIAVALGMGHEIPQANTASANLPEEAGSACSKRPSALPGESGRPEVGLELAYLL